MKDIELFGAGLRLIGIYLGIRTIGFVTDVYIAFQQSEALVPYEDTIRLPNLGWPFATLMVILALGLLLFPLSIAKSLLPKSSEQRPNIDIDSERLTVSGIILLGIYTISWAFPDFIYNGLMLVQMRRAGLDGFEPPELIVREIVSTVELIIGLYLTFGSQVLYKIIRSLRR